MAIFNSYFDITTGYMIWDAKLHSSSPVVAAQTGLVSSDIMWSMQKAVEMDVPNEGSSTCEATQLLSVVVNGGSDTRSVWGTDLPYLFSI